MNLRRWKASPRTFISEVLGVTPDEWQGSVLDAIAEKDRVAVRSGHGVGKTALLSWAVLWWLTTRTPCKVPVIAASADQLRDTIWPELGRWHAKMPKALRLELILTAERLEQRVDEGQEPGFATARVASKDRPEALQGFHSENLLVLGDEASAIEVAAFDVLTGALSSPGAKMLLTGNPTRLSGYFWDTFNRSGVVERWVKFKVNAETIPRAQGHIEDIIARYGKDSNAYRIRVLGEFPTTTDEQVIPLDLVQAAVARNVEPVAGPDTIWGLDVARFGDDRTALAKRKGNVLLEHVKWWRQKDTMQVAGLVKAEWDYLAPHDRPRQIVVDSIGLGAGVADRLRELGLPARDFNVGEQPAAKERYSRLRDEIWFSGREWFAARNVKIPKDDALIAELTSPTYSFSSSGKIVVESKDDMKKRGLPSPDLADAFLMTLMAGDRTKRSRIEYPTGPRRSPWV